jgi:soluble lytic murein transglycosylase-like protein
VYTGVSSTGVVTLSSFASESASLLLMASDPESQPTPLPHEAPDNQRIKPMPQRDGALRTMIDGVAYSVGVAPELIHAVIAVESNYDVQALSRRGAMGLMQLMPATAQRFGATNPYLAQDNVYAGARYLKWLMDYFDGNLELALAAYNAGEGSVVKAGLKVPRYAETQAYVQRVMATLKAAARPRGVQG